MHRRNEPFELSCAKRQPFARGGGEDQSVDLAAGIVPDQPPQRWLVELSRRETASPAAAIGPAIECEDQSWFHLLAVEAPETGQNKKPRQPAGFFGSALQQDVYRARRSEAPGRGPFFEIAAHEFVIIGQS